MYQERDLRVIDYELYPLPGTDHVISGPRPGDSRAGSIPRCSSVRLKTSGCFCGVGHPPSCEQRRPGLVDPGMRICRRRARASFSIKRVAPPVRKPGTIRDRPGHVGAQRGQLGLRHRRGSEVPQKGAPTARELGAEPAYQRIAHEAGSPELCARRLSKRHATNWVKSYAALFKADRGTDRSCFGTQARHARI